jgi:hypothetical protein
VLVKAAKPFHEFGGFPIHLGVGSHVPESYQTGSPGRVLPDLDGPVLLPEGAGMLADFHLYGSGPIVMLRQGQAGCFVGEVKTSGKGIKHGFGVARESSRHQHDGGEQTTRFHDMTP